MMRRGLIAVLALMPSVALGATFSVPLPEFVGTVSFSPLELRTAHFDFGQRFSSIEGLAIEVESRATAHVYQTCFTSREPACGERVVQLPIFRAVLQEEVVLSLFWTDPFTTGDDPGVLEAEGTVLAPFHEVAFSPPSGFHFLLDGRGSLYLSARYSPPTVGGMFIRDLTVPSAEVLSARLILDATPIPEPATGLLIGLGLAGLAVTRVPSASSRA